MKHEWIARAKRFATYALVGCFDTGMDWVAFTTAHELLHFTPMLCQAIGYAVGTVCSYFLTGASPSATGTSPAGGSVRALRRGTWYPSRSAR